jgi:hypothetical protein
MRKLIHSTLALAAVLSATSCTQESLKLVQDSSTVTFTVEMPEAATKAEDDDSQVDQLVYAVYRIKGNHEAAEAKSDITNPDVCQIVYQRAQSILGENRTIVHLEVIKNQRYIVLFWAQNENAWFTHTESLDDPKLPNLGEFAITYPTGYKPNSDKYDAFTGAECIEVDGSASKSIKLTRPFGQLNIAANLPDRLNVTVQQTTVTVLEGAAAAYNVATGKGSDQTSPIVFEATAPISGKFRDYDVHLSMNYVFVPEEKTNIKVKYDIATQSHGTVTDEISNVPVAKNYRTNIVGNLLTNDISYDVTLENTWNTTEFTVTKRNDGTQEDNEIWYTDRDNHVFWPTSEKPFGDANIISNEYDAAKGVCIMTFDMDVTTIGKEAFFDLTNGKWITSIMLPETVTSIGENAFYQCGRLAHITLGSNVKTIASNAFYKCISLKEIVCKSATPPVIADETVFEKVPTAATLIVPAGSVAAYSQAPYWSGFTNITTTQQIENQQSTNNKQ